MAIDRIGRKLSNDQKELRRPPGGCTFDDLDRLCTTEELWGIVTGETTVDSDWTEMIAVNVLKSRGELDGF